MLKLSKLFRALLSVGILRMTPEDTSGGGGGVNSGGGDGGQGGGMGGGGGSGGNPDPYGSAPKSWSPDTHTHWGAISPEARRIIHEREGHYERGINGYKTGHETWGRLSGYFKDVTAQNPQFDVAGLYEGLGQNHLALVKATPEQRRTMLGEIAKYYGVDFAQQVADNAGGGGAAPNNDPAVKKMIEDAIKNAVGPLYQQRQAEHLQKMQATVDAFFSDPQNEYISKVAAPMMELVKGGVRDLKTAYQMACLNDKEVAPLYLAKLSGGNQPGGQEGEEGTPSKPGDRNVRGSGSGAPPGKGKTIDQTMKAVLEKNGWK